MRLTRPSKKQLAMFLNPLMLLTSCVSQRVNRTGPNPLPQDAPNTSLPQQIFPSQSSIGLGLKELRSAKLPTGPLWQTLLLPAPASIVYPKDLLLGIKPDNTEEISAPPKPGTCSTMTKGAPLGNSQQSSRNKVKTSAAGRPVVVTGLQPFDIAFFTSETTNNVLAIGTSNQSGQIECILPFEKILVTVGYGNSRSDQKISAEKSFDKLQFKTQKSGLGIFFATKNVAEQNPAALLRIGRFTNPDEFAQVSSKINNDLYQKLSFPSKNLGASEALRTTFLLPNSPISISLDIGEYVALFFIPSEQKLCFQKFTITPGKSINVSCSTPWLKSNETGEEDNKLYSEYYAPETIIGSPRAIVFEGTALPASVQQSKEIQEWMLRAGFTDLLFFNQANTSEGEMEFTKIGSNQAPNPIQGAKERNSPHAGPYFGSLNAGATGDLLKRSQFVRVITAQNSFEAGRQVSKFFSSSDHTVVPFAGTGEDPLVFGTTPFLIKNTMKVAPGNFFSPETSESLSSNGAIINWLDPQPLSTRALLTMPLMQKFSIMVSSPPYYQLDYAEIYVNSQVFGRWVIPRESALATVTEGAFRTQKLNSNDFLIEIKIEKTEDFYISVAAWSKSFLPELLTGSSGMPGFVFTRAYCVDANDNGVCEAMQ